MPEAVSQQDPLISPLPLTLSVLTLKMSWVPGGHCYI